MHRLIYPDVGKCRAMIIDGNPTSRSIQAGMLRQMGVGSIQQTSKVADARRVLEGQSFDIVLCDYHFDSSSTTGQDLLDDLRRAQLLPYSTVFIMVTSEASYSSVAEAAETALDSYLLKPHTALALERRLIQARHRKTTLRSIFEAIESGEFKLASDRCQARFDARAQYWLYAARIGAELYIRLGDHVAARALYEAVQATNALPWAKLGIARAEVEAGQLTQATGTLQSLISQNPDYADAYDVMGRVQVEQGNLAAALETYRCATRITPNSIARLQKQGMLAFYLGDADEATRSLERTARLGLNSKTFDYQSLVLIALLTFDRRDSKAFARNHESLVQESGRQPESTRLQRFVRISEVFLALNERRVSDCVRHVRSLVADVASENFDFEAASNLLALLARVRNTEIQLPESEQWIGKLARRFCVSKASTELLCLTQQGDESSMGLIRAGQAQIASIAEKAMTHSVSGSPATAVRSLVASGAQMLNAKLIELAGLVLARHALKIDGSEELAVQIDDLKRRYCSQGTQVSMGQAAPRAPGGVALRT